MNKHWQEQLKQTWGIDAVLTPLDGEFDLNFKARTQDGRQYLMKVMRADCDTGFVEMQCNVLVHINATGNDVKVPTVIRSLAEEKIESIADEDGDTRLVWVLDYVDGMIYAHFAPKSLDLIRQLGSGIAHLQRAMSSFSHPALERDFKWNLMQADWINESVSAIGDTDRVALIQAIMLDYQSASGVAETMANTVIHNDINDHNVIIRSSLTDKPSLAGIIDFGDMCSAPRVCELAIAGAYIVLDHPQAEKALAALITGFHSVLPLTGQEIDLIYPLLRARLAVSVVNSSLEAIARPDDPYVVVSQAQAFRFLERDDITPALLNARLRVACGLSCTDSAQRIQSYLSSEVRNHCANVLRRNLHQEPCIAFSVERSSVPQDPFKLSDGEAASLYNGDANPGEFALGYYNEPRLIYTDKAFRRGAWRSSNRRTVHLGIDVFAPAGTHVHAPIDGSVYAVENRTAQLDYGGMVVLMHETPDGDTFYSLYGHLDPAASTHLQPGMLLKAGEVFAELGDKTNNGGWAPHLHIQLAVTVDGLGNDWPGVADPDEIELWNAICPNPSALLNLADERITSPMIDEDRVLDRRQRYFGANLKLSYREPIMLLRGWQHYLFDQWGRPYLDAYNNVPHVGHAHPRIQSVVSRQWSQLNTNTRYLHPSHSAFAERLQSKLPDSLSVCYFVNSGSEANELALRLSRAHTGAKDIITPDHGYHGNTTGAIDISAYKFNAAGGVGQADWVHLVDIPDSYAGTYRHPNPDCAIHYANQVDDAIARLQANGCNLAGFIAETFPSVGGQVIPPDGYLAQVYRSVRAAGGVCIADEVQTGLGRLGDYYFAFEQQQVVPDIVVLGKPVGNGHPIGVVVTTPEIAKSFAEGPEFFSTFGGSTVSCLVGKEVLDIVDEEGLAMKAAKVGKRAIDGLNALKSRHPVVGDVRGIGLFIGVVFVTDPQSRNPATEIAAYVVNRLREHRILAGLEGPANNILKIRPPLSIDEEDIDLLLQTLDGILAETAITGSLGKV